jgi:hypothetical protein
MLEMVRALMQKENPQQSSAQVVNLESNFGQELDIMLYWKIRRKIHLGYGRVSLNF